jgi:hypothetical protein
MARKRPAVATFVRAAKAAAFSDGEFVGWCVKCWAKAYGVDPDCRKDKCEACGAEAVYGAEELVLMYA